MKKVAFIALKIVVMLVVIYATGYIYQAIHTQRKKRRRCMSKELSAKDVI